MAFDRRIELIIAPAKDITQHESSTATTTGVLISDLDISFKVTRSNLFSDNTAEFKIYNANSDTRAKLLQTGGNVLFRLGYKDQGALFGPVFIGNISAPSVSKRESDGTWVTEIKASSVRADEKPLQTTYVSLSYSKDTPIKTILQELADAMGLVLSFGSIDPVPLPNGWAYAGNIRGAFDYCNKILRSNGSALFVDNGELVVYALQGDSTFTAAYLTYDSGLISVEESTPAPTNDKRKPVKKATKPKKKRTPEEPQPLIPSKVVHARCLINPAIKPNSVIKIETPTVNGAFIVQKAIFIGDNFGGDFNCEIEAAFFDVVIK